MPLGAGSIVKDTLVLERELGAGGMGVVWVARHRTLDSHVAVKVLRAASVTEEAARARFEREARAIARLDSPHVVRVFDYGISEEGEPFFVMELLRGRDLRSHIDDRGPLGSEATARILRQACAALGSAHELGIVHRDIKPANIFLVDGSDEVFVKLLDFGVAKMADHDLAMTATQTLLGTPYYMSPEQFIDPRRIDHRSDLWSLAVVAYACLVGRLPFKGESVGALSLAVHLGDFTPPSAAEPAVSAAFDAWFARAFDPDPDRRFQSARELAESFAAIAGGASLEEPRPPASKPPDATTAREPRATTGEPVVTEIAPMAATVHARPAMRVPPEREPPESTRSARAPRSVAAAPRAATRPVVLVAAVAAAALFAGLSVGLLVSRRDAPATVASPVATDSRAHASDESTQATASSAAGTASAPPTGAAVSASNSVTAEPAPVAPVSASASSATAASTSAVPQIAAPAPVPSGSNLARGAQCARPDQCTSGFCVDAVCCDTACARKCFTCNDRKKFGFAQGGDGSCGFIESGRDPDGECPGAEVCDGFGRCSLPENIPRY